MAAPGMGAGRQAAAKAGLKQMLDVMVRFLSAFQPGSGEFNALMDAMKILTKTFGGGGDDQGLKAAAMMQMQKPQGGGPPIPPGIAGQAAGGPMGGKPPGMPGMPPQLGGMG